MDSVFACWMMNGPELQLRASDIAQAMRVLDTVSRTSEGIVLINPRRGPITS